MDTGFGVGIALDSDGLARSFARARVGGRSLAAHGQAAQVPDAAVGLDALEPLQVHTDFAAQVAFDHVLSFLDGVNDLGELLFGEILRADARLDVCAFEDHHRVGRSDPVNVSERDINAFVPRNLNTNNACH